MDSNAQRMLAWVAAAWVRSTAYNWLLRQGAAQWLAHALALLAGSATQRAIATA